RARPALWRRTYCLPRPSTWITGSATAGPRGQMMSANVRSVFQKYQNPLTNRPRTMTGATTSANPSTGGADSPNSDQRTPSITPTIGLNAYSVLYASGRFFMVFRLNPTGDRYSPNWTMNGIT